jgi:hypothetical protein
MLYAQEDGDPQSEGYRFAVAEIVRGIHAVSGLQAHADITGWIAIQCGSASMAHWLSESIKQENVQARDDGSLLFVPVGDYFTIKGEIKNVITVVAKTTHYWHEHVPIEVKRTLALQENLGQFKSRILRWLGRA